MSLKFRQEYLVWVLLLFKICEILGFHFFMPPRRSASSASFQSATPIGFEAKRKLTADKLRINMEAREPSGAGKTAAASPQGERGGAHQFYTPG